MGLILGAFGLVMMNFGNPTPSSKAIGDSWDSTWKATRLYQVNQSFNDNYRNDLVTIGVYKWEVTGEVAGTNFTETWTGPDPASINIEGRNQSVGGCKVNYDRNLWLAGCVYNSILGHPGYAHLIFRLKDIAVTDAFSEGNLGSGDQSSWSGGTAKCGNSPIQNFTGCYTTLGSYGFGHYYNRPNGGNDTGVLISASNFIPLQWEVHGETVE